MGGCPLPAVPGPATFLSQGEEMLKTLEARKADKPGQFLAKGKKGRLRAILRPLWSKKRPFKAYIQGLEIGGPSGGSHNSSEIHRAAQLGRPRRKSESGDAVREMSPEEKKGGE